MENKPKYLVTDSGMILTCLLGKKINNEEFPENYTEEFYKILIMRDDGTFQSESDPNGFIAPLSVVFDTPDKAYDFAMSRAKEIGEIAAYNATRQMKNTIENCYHNIKNTAF